MPLERDPRTGRLHQRSLHHTVDRVGDMGVASYTNEEAQDAVGNILVDSTTIDLTYNDGVPSITGIVIDDSITYAKMQNVSAASRLLGRGDSGAGDPQEIILGTNLSMAGTTLNAASFQPLDTDLTEIAAVANVRGDLLVTDAGPTWVRLGIGASPRILQSDGTDPSWVAVSADATLAAGGALTIATDAVTYAKMQDISAASRLLGRGSAAGAGDPEEIVLGTNLSFAGTTLNATGGVTDHGALTGLTDDDHLQYLLLLGRAGSTNDPVLSTTTGGILSGSSASGQALDLQSTTHATKSLINARDELRLRTTLTSVTGAAVDTFLARGLLAATVDNGLAEFVGIGLTGTLTQNTAPISGTHALFAAGSPFNALTYQNASGVASFAPFAALANFMTYKAITTNITGGHIRTGLYLGPTFSRDAAITMTGVDITGIYDAPTINTGCTIDERRGLYFLNRTGSGAQTTAVAVDVEDQTVGTLGLALRSVGAAVQSRHVGPVVVGANAGPTTVNIGLELQSMTDLFMPSRLTTAQRDANTYTAADDGLFFYNSTTGTHQARKASAWVDVPGAPGAGASWTTVETDVGSTPISQGKFTITDAAISGSSKVIIMQAPGPYTGKGTALSADEGSCDPITAIAQPGSGSAIVRWETAGKIAMRPAALVGGFGARNTTTAVPPGYPIADLISKFIPTRIGRVKGNIKFSYTVAV